jgi:hypothetical protein
MALREARTADEGPGSLGEGRFEGGKSGVRAGEAERLTVLGLVTPTESDIHIVFAPFPCLS